MFPRASSVYGHMSFAVDCWHLDDVIDGFHQLINTPLIVLIQITSPGSFLTLSAAVCRLGPRPRETAEVA